MSYSTIVVGYDGSTNAEQALDQVIAIGGPETTVHIVLAHTGATTAEVARAWEAAPPELRSRIDVYGDLRDSLEVGTERLEAADLGPVKPHLLEGNPAEAILALAEESDADLIVVGSRGLGAASRFIRGSVSARIANHAHTSFLVVHDRAA